MLSSIQGPTVKASFECLDTSDQISRIYEGDQHPTDKNSHVTPTYTKVHDIPIQDLRGQEDKLNLQTHGFEYLKTSPKSSIHPFEDDHVSSYLEEVTELVKRELKADAVICYDYRVRL